jgi:hypothetical protein
MIYSNVILTVKDEADIEKVRELLVQQGTLSKQEPCCARFEIYHSKSAPTLFMLIGNLRSTLTNTAKEKRAVKSTSRWYCHSSTEFLIRRNSYFDGGRLPPL